MKTKTILPSTVALEEVVEEELADPAQIALNRILGSLGIGALEAGILFGGYKLYQYMGAPSFPSGDLLYDISMGSFGLFDLGLVGGIAYYAKDYLVGTIQSFIPAGVDGKLFYRDGSFTRKPTLLDINEGLPVEALDTDTSLLSKLARKGYSKTYSFINGVRIIGVGGKIANHADEDGDIESTDYNLILTAIYNNMEFDIKVSTDNDDFAEPFTKHKDANKLFYVFGAFKKPKNSDRPMMFLEMYGKARTT